MSDQRTTLGEVEKRLAPLKKALEEGRVKLVKPPMPEHHRAMLERFRKRMESRG